MRWSRSDLLVTLDRVAVSDPAAYEMSNNRRVLSRQWQIIQCLNAHRNGVRTSKLEEVTERSRATIYRDLQTLREAGVPIETETVNGEARHRLLRPVELPHLNLTSLQVCALHLARAELQPLAGTGLVQELDELLERVRPPQPQQTFSFAQPPPTPPRTGNPILRQIERAFAVGRRARIQYRAAYRRGKVETRTIEPLLVKVARRDVYLRAYCIEHAGERLYKLARIASFELLAEPVTYVPTEPASRAFDHSVKVWNGKPVTVEMRLDPDVAWLASEYPLLESQRVRPAQDGSAVVSAEVSGTVEAMRWVLSWGGSAEALSPAELRDATRAELEKAAAKYRGPTVAPARRRAAETVRNKLSRAS
jgi:predicted DNA-binding transcriptional regulator YafY